MSATITAHTDHSITLEVTIELLPSMLESERSIQVALNEAGCLTTGSALEQIIREIRVAIGKSMTAE